MTIVSQSQLKRVSYAEAAGILATRDPMLGRLIEQAGPIRLSRRTGRRRARSAWVGPERRD